MPISINGTGTITGISAGGLPDGCITEADLSTAAVTTDKIAAGAVTTPKITGGPAFSATANAGATISHNTFTKVAFQVEEYDTASCYDNTTNYRFTPNVAGYYQVTARTQFTASAGTGETLLLLYKNGADHRRGVGSSWAAYVNAVIYFNGTTDYVETYMYQGTGSPLSITGVSGFAYFQAFLIRPA